MDITMEDVKVCNCCGAPIPVDCMRQVEINQAWSKIESDLTTFNLQTVKFNICENCENELIGTVLTSDNVDKFLNDVSQGYDIYAMEGFGNTLGNLKALAKIWNNYGINAPE